MEENSPFQPSKIRVFKKRMFKGFVVLVLLVLAGIAIYFYTQYQNKKNVPQNSNQTAAEESENLINQIEKLIQLPTGEAPTIATVSDKTKLQDQPFFSKAENGDKVLIYSNAQKAILYRPSINKIIEVAPVNFGTNSEPNPNPTVSVSEAPTATVTITPTVTKSPLLTPQPIN